MAERTECTVAGRCHLVELPVIIGLHDGHAGRWSDLSTHWHHPSATKRGFVTRTSIGERILRELACETRSEGYRVQICSAVDHSSSAPRVLFIDCPQVRTFTLRDFCVSQTITNSFRCFWCLRSGLYMFLVLTVVPAK